MSAEMPAVPTTYDLREVERTLCEGDDTAELGIHLELHGGRLFVRGDVASDERRRHVLDCVRERIGGDVPLVDELTVAAEGLAHAPTGREEIS
jgi:hypothetical protein